MSPGNGLSVGRFKLFLWERIDCGRLILFVGGFEYHMNICKFENDCIIGVEKNDCKL